MGGKEETERDGGSSLTFLRAVDGLALPRSKHNAPDSVLHPKTSFPIQQSSASRLSTLGHCFFMPPSPESSCQLTRRLSHY